MLKSFASVNLLIIIGILSGHPAEVTALNEIPAGQCDDFEFYAHNMDCSKYFLCIDGQYVERRCPSNLHFNLEVKFCDWPETANCQLITTQEPTTEFVEGPPFDEFGDCLEYTTAPGYGYSDFFDLSTIGRQNGAEGFIELKVFVQTATNAHVLLSPEKSWSSGTTMNYYEIVNMNNESYQIKRRNTVISARTSRVALLESNQLIPLIIRIFINGLIELQVAGEQRSFLTAEDANPFSVRYISFGTHGTAIGHWLYNCQINPIPRPPPVRESDGICNEFNSNGYEFTEYIPIFSITNSRPNEDIVVTLYVQTAGESVFILLSSMDYMPTGNPYYEIQLGNQSSIHRRFTRLAQRASSTPLFSVTRKVSVVLNINQDGRVQVTIDGQNSPILNGRDVHPIDVQYISFSSADETSSKWFYDC